MTYSKYEAVLRHYALYADRIAQTPSDEWAMDAYAWDNGGRSGINMTPIEFLLWHDIRQANAVLYPQYPVGRFFVDFGNPAAKVAIECDGKEFHQDVRKDQARQQEIEAMGWRVYRISGAGCYHDTTEEIDEYGDVEIVPSAGSQLLELICSAHPIRRGSLGRRSGDAVRIALPVCDFIDELING